ncbi:MAG TPA: hypothetical protein VFM93_13070 [Candidatus Limnocylindria bacterium]|nr:hypothetical protein [Candidatus Limnocylindria bacterium]
MDSRVHLVGRTLIWASDEVLPDGQRRGQILEHDLATGTTRRLYTAAARNAVQNVRASANWLVWYEFGARSSAVDTRLYAMPRAGGAPLLIDDARTHGQFVLPADMTLAGDDVYWTVPEVLDGVWRGRLLRQRLPSGPQEVIATAPPGAVIAWPSASRSAVVYELFSKDAPFTSVAGDNTPGYDLAVLVPPVSQPSLGDGFLAFKLGERFKVGRVGIAVGARAHELGPGEHPEAQGRIVTWAANTSTDSEIRVAFADRPSCVLTVTRNRDLRGTHEFLPSLGEGRLLWVVRDTRRPVGDQDRIRVAPVAPGLCVG